MNGGGAADPVECRSLQDFCREKSPGFDHDLWRPLIPHGMFEPSGHDADCGQISKGDAICPFFRSLPPQGSHAVAGKRGLSRPILIDITIQIYPSLSRFQIQKRAPFQFGSSRRAIWWNHSRPRQRWTAQFFSFVDGFSFLVFYVSVCCVVCYISGVTFSVGAV